MSTGGQPYQSRSRTAPERRRSLSKFNHRPRLLHIPRPLYCAPSIELDRPARHPVSCVADLRVHSAPLRAALAHKGPPPTTHAETKITSAFKHPRRKRRAANLVSHHADLERQRSFVRSFGRSIDDYTYSASFFFFFRVSLRSSKVPWGREGLAGRSAVGRRVVNLQYPTKRRSM